MSPAGALALMFGAFLGTAVAALLAPSGRAARYVTGLGAATGSLAGLAVSGFVLAAGRPVELALPGLLAVAGGIVFRLDALGAVFLAIIAMVGLPAAVYGVSYTATYEGRHSLRVLGLMFNTFLLGMSLVPSAGNVVTFLIGWELMAVSSYFLVMTEADREETRQAGLWYLAMTHGGLVLLLPMFFLMAPAGSGLTFSELRAGAADLSPAARGVVFLLAVAAFGSKAGIVPLHVWLPRAHPAAPSHVSALMSGVMIKLGIYGLLRVGLDIMGGGPPWWGGLLLALGSISALLGVLYALMEHDLKRLLAYHSVENIGIILIGLGAGFMLQSYGLEALAVVGFVGGLYHTLNHACFKGLLFLGAGNVLHQAHTRNMEEMGGLIKRMPQTAALFLVGSAAIAALPPLNGFASEWMVFQALLAGGRIPRPGVAVGMPIAVGLLALTSGLAAACFVKAFGISFLAMPRSEGASSAREAPRAMRLAMALLASACIALGLGAAVPVSVLQTALPAGAALAQPGRTPLAAGSWIEIPEGFGQLSPALLAALLVAIALPVVLATRLRQRRPIRLADTWGCGRIGQTPRMEYTASAFAEPLRRVFAELYRPTEDLTVTAHPDSPYFVRSITYRSEVQPWIETAIYHRLIRGVVGAGTLVRRVQAGPVNLYLVYVVAALLAALASVWWLR